MKVSRITIGRLFNLGSYEHIRYEITVEVPEGESAEQAVLGIEHILEALKPESKCCVSSRAELDREYFRVTEMQKLLREQGPEEFTRRHGHFVGTPEEYIQRCEDTHLKNLAKREAYEKRAAEARRLFDDLGGAAQWKDAKLDWENEDNF